MSVVVLLNGSPSSGKTTLAREVVRALEIPVFYMSYDAFRPAVPARHWQDDAKPLFGRLLRPYLSMLQAVRDSGVVVVAESVILPENRPLYEELLKRSVLVGVKCPLQVAQTRENQRADRRQPMDLDVPEFHLVHNHDYDIEVDTSTEFLGDMTQRVAAAVLQRVDSSQLPTQSS